MDILLQVNDYFGTEYEIDTPWTDLFAEPEQQEALRLQRLRSLESPRAAAAGPGAALAAALAAHQQANGAGAAAAAGGGLNWLDAELPSEDEDDGSYSEPGGLMPCLFLFCAFFRKNHVARWSEGLLHGSVCYLWTSCVLCPLGMCMLVSMFV